jgi:quercetin dioxygenase-like cupin family protein
MNQSSDPRLQIVHRQSQSSGLRLGPYLIESLLSEAEESAATVYRVRIDPHQRTNISYHKIAEEFYYVLAGQGTAILNGQEYPLAPGDFLRLPPGTTHSFVTGAEPLEMLDVHTPGCRPNHDVYFVDETPEGFTSPSKACTTERA